MHFISEPNSGLFKGLALFYGGRSVEYKRGLAQAVATMMSKSTENKNHKQLQTLIDYYGGQIDIYVSAQYLTMEVTCLSRYAVHMIELMYEIIYLSTFNLKEWNIQRPILQDIIRQQEFQTDYWANKMVNEALFGENHSTEYYSRPEDYDGISIHDIRTYYQENIILHKPTWFLAGANLIPVKSLIVDKEQDSYHQGNKKNKSLPPPLNTSRYMELKIPQAAQSSVRLSLVISRINLEDYMAIDLISFYLGGHYLSELMSELRIRKAYTYGVYSHCVHHKTFSILTISYETDEHHIESSLKAIKGLFSRLKSRKTIDFSAIREQYIASYSKQSEQALNEILYKVRFHKLKLSYTQYKQSMNKKFIPNQKSIEKYLSLILDYNTYTKAVAY